MTNWLYHTNPTEPGWYPVLMCWDVEEGVFPGACFWNGDGWQSQSATIGYWPVRCKSVEEAEDLAYKNDPDL